MNGRRRRTRVKFCGMTVAGDVAEAVDAGADAVGFIVASSPRRVNFEALPELRAAVPPFTTAVAVVARESADLAPALVALGFTIQFSGPEAARDCERLAGGRPYIKAVHIAPGTDGAVEFGPLLAYERATLMFDAASATLDGGTGRTFDWNLVASLAARRPIIVSGGLTPENVGLCVRTVRPYAVDVRSGIETGGRSDRSKMRAFVRAVREADAEA